MDPESEAFSTLSDYQLALLTEMNRYPLTYLIFGGYAVRFYGCIRPARDLDLFMERTEANVNTLINILSKLGAEKLEVARSHLMKPEKKVIWRRVDIVTTMPEFEFDKLYENVTFAKYKDLRLPLISLKQLVSAKQFALQDPNRKPNWPKDEKDLKCLAKLVV